MTKRRRLRPRRRNRLSTRENQLVILIAVAAGVVGALADCQPTQTEIVDPMLTGLLAFGVTWAAATASWWAIAGAAAVLGLAGAPLWATALALAACASMLYVGATKKSWAPVRAAAGGACTVVAFRLDIDEPFAASALLAALALGLIGVTGLARRGRRVRRRATWIAVGLAGAVAIAVAGAVIGALGARQDLERGIESARDGLAALRDGDAPAAAVHLEQAAASLRSARGDITGPWAWPSRAVPVLSQHMRAASSLTDAAADAAETVSRVATDVDLETVRVRAGQIDLAALESLSAPLSETVGAVEALTVAVADSRSGWLVGPVAQRLGELSDETTAAGEQARNALEVTELAPRLLGRDGERTWLVLFTTPAEARGLGGFPGNFAELYVDGGFISVTRIGRATELIAGGDNPARRFLTGPADYLARYGPVGAGGSGNPTDLLFWNNVTLSPDLPSVAQVVAELYPQSGGRPIDGVIVADPYALQGMVALTGPLTIEGRDAPLTATDTANYLLREQYLAFPGENQERKDALEAVAVQATEALLSNELPSPAVIARALGEPARTGHLMIWSLHEADQGPLRRLGVAGDMPAPAPDGFAYTVNNSGPNKLDAYLQREVVYDSIVEPDSGRTAATVTIRLRNTVPLPLTLAPDVSGNERGLPAGTNRVWLSLYSPHTVVDTTLDGAPYALTTSRELGWNVFSTYVNVPAGGEIILTVRLGGTLDLDDGYGFTWRSQPLALDEELAVTIRDDRGTRLATHEGPLDVVTHLRAIP